MATNECFTLESVAINETKHGRSTSNKKGFQHTKIGTQKPIFVGQKDRKNKTEFDTLKPAPPLGCSLICPINGRGTPYSLGYSSVGYQLSLSLNVFHIDIDLDLAVNGFWSDFDLDLNRVELVDLFLTDFKNYLNLKRFNKSLYSKVFSMLLSNLFYVHQVSGQLLVPRKNGCINHNHPRKFDQRNVARVCDYLADRGFIDLHIGRNNETSGNASWCIPLMPLISLIDRSNAQICLHETAQFAEVRDGNKQAMPMYTNRNQAIKLIRLGSPVKRHYETWLNHTATLDGLYLRPWLKRIFNWNMNLGGRFYGDYQQIPSKDRKRILINGHKTVELDFKAFHIALLYAKNGLSLDIDPYVIPPYGQDFRKAFKAICLRLVNAEDLPSLKASITRSGKLSVQRAHLEYKNKRELFEYHKGTGRRVDEPVKPKSLKGFIDGIPIDSKGEDLIDLLLETHAPIKHEFSTPKIGLILQRLDSEVMARTLDKLPGLPCLPVHDSIRCRVADAGLVRNAMIDAFRELHGQNIVVEDDLPRVK